MKLTYQNHKLYLIFPYDEKIIDKVKSIPAAKWDKKKKAWEFPATVSCYEAIREKFDIKINSIEKSKSKMPSKLKFNQYEFKTKPFGHQISAIKFIMNKFAQYDGLSKGCALFMDMGTGKSKVIIDTAEMLYSNNLIKNILVICPLSICSTWEEELKTHSSHSLWDTLLGGKSKRIEVLDDLFNSKNFLNWHIINVDGIATIQDELANKKFDMVVVDESTTIKNRSAQRTKLIIDLFFNTPYKIIMSGNPIPKSSDEIFSQYKFIDAGIFGASYYSFLDQYCDVDYFGKVTNLKSEKDFSDKLHSISFRITKQECLDLPERIYEKKFIDMTDKQKKIYEEMKKDAITSYEDITCAAPVVITKFLRLSQIAGGIFPGEENSIKLIIPNPKLEALIETISELPSKEQVVVWARFRAEIQIISDRLNKEGISNVTFYGDTSHSDRKIAEEKILNKSARIFISNPATGGYGINFLKGINNVIFYSLDYSAGTHQQAMDRTYRIGTKGTVVYIYLLMKKSIDESVYFVLKNNKDFSDAILSRSLDISL